MREQAIAPSCRWQHESDEALVTQIVAGEELALAELYDRFGPRAYGLALRVLRDRGLAEEAVQDAFLSVWRSAEGFDRSRGLVQGWLFTIVHRRAVDLVQRAVRRPVASDEEAPEVATASTEQTAGQREEQRVVRHALEQIPHAQREALELAYYGGHSQSQIADRLGVPIGTIKTRIFNGLCRLRVLLIELGPASRS